MYHKVPCITSARTHGNTDTHTDTQTNKLNTITLLCKINKHIQGHDGISVWLLKNCMEEIKITITHIMNLSLSSGLVPDKMKIARVIPIHKSGNNSLFNNYRPISMLPALSKILEFFLHNRLISFWDKNEILHV